MATTDANADRPADVAWALSEVWRRLRNIVPSPEYDVRRSAFSLPAHTDVPVFRGFQDDAVRWVQLIDGLAARLAWPEHVKWPLAVQRLQNAARAWHLYEGHLHSNWETWSEALITAFGNFPGAFDARFMKMRDRRQGPGENVVTYVYEKLHLLRGCNLEWTSPVARQYVVDGLADSTHAAILAVQPPEMKLQSFIHLAAELQHSASREAREPYQQAPVHSLEESASPSPQWGDMSLNDEKGTSDTALIVIKDEVSQPPSFSDCAQKCRRKPTEANELQITESQVDENIRLEHRQGRCTQLNDLDVGHNASRSESLPSAPEGLQQDREDELTIPLSTPNKQSENGSSHFSNIVTPTPWKQNNGRNGSSLEYFNSSNVPAEGHVLFTATCHSSNRTERLSLQGRQKTIEMDFLSNSSVDTFQVSVKQQPIVLAKADEADHKGMPSVITNHAAPSVQPGDTKIKVGDLRKDLVCARPRSVAECRDANRCKEAAATAVSGQSAAKAVRSAADWKRKKKRVSTAGRINMASE